MILETDLLAKRAMTLVSLLIEESALEVLNANIIVMNKNNLTKDIIFITRS